ncbi:hypothetical protein FMM55_08285 [Campylobacter sp. LR196d]|uniref:hypothetical protein n=1 Tax=Campylobacter sp. LR196d TaxID=2593543 RepID=UPI00123A095A|nr:hypothetical protein [Campylobacter sp. LR196d]KAA6224986.1 hypothetical protein FMM55_08285 [Campylobacter sp. LR196d]
MRFCLIFLVLFFTACSSSKFVQSNAELNNEGIFIKARVNESFKITLQNPSSIETNFKESLKEKLLSLGLKEDINNPDYELLINLVNFKKHIYALKVSRSGTFFYDFTPMEPRGEWMVENYYSMQMNIKIKGKQDSGQTSILAKTAFISDKTRCQLSLENSIAKQIKSFFFMQ